MDDNNWFAWVVEQSLDSQELFTQFEQVIMKSNRKDWKEHVLRVPNEQVSLFIKVLETHLLPGWYAHMIQGENIKVIFKDMSFDGREGDSMFAIEAFALKNGISSSEMNLNELFEEAKKLGI